MAIAIISPHAAVGIRFQKAACVYPCEFNTSFMPAMTRANGCRLFNRRWLDCRPQLGLQLNRAGADLPQLFFIVNSKK